MRRAGWGGRSARLALILASLLGAEDQVEEGDVEP